MHTAKVLNAWPGHTLLNGSQLSSNTSSCVTSHFYHYERRRLWRLAKPGLLNHVPDATFQNQASNAIFQNHPPDARLSGVMRNISKPIRVIFAQKLTRKTEEI